MEENQLKIVLVGYAIAGSFGLAYLFYSPLKVRNIQLYLASVFPITSLYILNVILCAK